MASKYSHSPERRRSKLNTVWLRAFISAELPLLAKRGQLVKPEGLAHLAAEYADASLNEYRRRFSR